MYEFLYKKTWTPPGTTARLLLIMRLTTLLLITAIMQVSAGSLAQKITLSEKNTPLISVFEKISTQTGYDFLVTKSMLKHAKPVNVTVKNAELKDVLKDIFQNQQLNFVIEEKTVVVSQKELSVLDKLAGYFRQDSVNYKGTVYDENGQPMPGATILLKGGTRTTRTTPEGNFAIYGPAKGTLVISYIGYANKEFNINAKDAQRHLKINMATTSSELGEVSIVSTGYQDLPKERATGSFEVITAKQLQHSTDPNLLRRLEGITTSIDFRNTLRPTNSSIKSQTPTVGQITIRGRNTLNVSDVTSNPSGWPLVVIDGIATPYSIDLVNPNDVESITILKDAASASIWGSRAANGVIVIKTKQGKFDRPVRVSFNSNFNVTEKLDLFYKKQMSVSDYVDAQIFAFSKEYPADDPNATIPEPDVFQPQMLFPPVWEILNRQKKDPNPSNPIYAQQLDALRGNDIRRDFDKYFLRNALTQSYSLSLDGGSKNIAYRLSGGYDKSINNTKGSSSNRFLLGYNTTVKLLKNLDLNGNITYSRQNSDDQSLSTKIEGSNIRAPFFPYSRLVDEQGNPVAMPKTYRPAFLSLLEETYENQILDMSYKPLEDMNQGYLRLVSHALNFNLNTVYRINSAFSASVAYNYNKGIDNSRELIKQDSWYMRNLINRFTDPETFTRNIPLGGLYSLNNGESDRHTLRGMFNVNKTWNDKHSLSAIAGVDVSQDHNQGRKDQYYGYNEKMRTISNQLNFAGRFRTLFNSLEGEPEAGIPFNGDNGFSETKVRMFSVFSNAAYTYNNRYTVSGSIRKDASSEFGLRTNNSGTPYFSFGASWIINNEAFYKLSWLPNLKLRATYGYNGNVNATVTARPVITYSALTGQSDIVTGLPYAITNNSATNRNLRPERTGIFNLGLDFGFKNNRLSGSIEYYDKRTIDLLRTNSVDPSTGFARVTFNTGDLHGYGVDFTLNSVNLIRNGFRWESNLLFSYNRVKISKLFVRGAQTVGQTVGDRIFTEGYDLNRLFAYRWAGLDPATGDPRVFFNGQPITIDGTDFELINAHQDAPVSELRYLGSAVPVYYGSFRNTVSYRAFTITANIMYKLNYYSRRPVSDMISYTSLFATSVQENALQGAEYNQRWKISGDERNTNVPSQVYPGNEARDHYYQYADINVIKADHIRVQEVNLAYSFQRGSRFIKNPRIYANINNLGILWRANKFGIDPDINDYPQPRTYSFGFSANF